MPSAQDNIATIRRGYELFNSGNMQELMGLFTEDAVWHVGGRNQLSGEKRGRDACFEYFGRIGELTNGNFQAELHGVVGDDEHTAGIQTSKGERDGKRLNEHTVLLFHLRDGKIAEAWEHFEDSRRCDEFWG